MYRASNKDEPPAEMTLSLKSMNSLHMSIVGFVPSSKYTARESPSAAGISEIGVLPQRLRTLDVIDPSFQEMIPIVQLFVQPDNDFDSLVLKLFEHVPETPREPACARRDR